MKSLKSVPSIAYKDLTLFDGDTSACERWPRRVLALFRQWKSAKKGTLPKVHMMCRSASLGLASKEMFPLSRAPRGQARAHTEWLQAESPPVVLIFRIFFMPCGMTGGDRPANQELVWGTACV